MSRDWLLGMAIVAVFIIGLGVCGCAEEAPEAKYPAADLVHVCNGRIPIWVYRTEGGRLYVVYGYRPGFIWLAPGVTPAQACSGGQ